MGFLSLNLRWSNSISMIYGLREDILYLPPKLSFCFLFPDFLGSESEGNSLLKTNLCLLPRTSANYNHFVLLLLLTQESASIKYHKTNFHLLYGMRFLLQENSMIFFLRYWLCKSWGQCGSNGLAGLSTWTANLKTGVVDTAQPRSLYQAGTPSPDSGSVGC